MLQLLYLKGAQKSSVTRNAVHCSVLPTALVEVVEESSAVLNKVIER